MLATILISVAVVGFLLFALMLRVIVGKDEEFRGTCATMNPMLVEKGIKCGCGKTAGTCDNPQQESTSEGQALPSIGNKN